MADNSLNPAIGATFDVASKLDKLNSKFSTVDITQLVKFENKIRELGNFNIMLAPQYMRDFIDAQDVCGVMLATAILVNEKSKALLEEAESIAYLDHATDYLNAKGIKDTADARKRYIDIDADVIRAKDIHAKSMALVSLLNNKLWNFKQAHDDVKKMSYSDQKMTPYDGM
ncbi:MAG: hypothetical protein HC840_27675 [Leptolyngbyaceae cyanobacterium RM2_2_4]|nr:hypothetical protein [Leptolyngbyaceae cyanobacterium RM2_2_4]